MHLADIRVWTDPLSGRGCFVRVWDDACDVELRALGAPVMTVTRPSVDAALATADEWRPDYLPRRERRTMALPASHRFFAGVDQRAQAADRSAPHARA